MRIESACVSVAVALIGLAGFADGGAGRAGGIGMDRKGAEQGKGADDEQECFSHVVQCVPARNSPEQFCEHVRVLENYVFRTSGTGGAGCARLHLSFSCLSYENKRI